MNIEEIFPGGEWKTESEYVIRCPICGDHPTHNHCHVNVVKGVFHCFFGGCGGSITKLLKHVGEKAIPEPRRGIIEKERHPEIDFSLFPKVMGDSNSLDRMAFTYLRRRGIAEANIDYYDIRYGNITGTKYYGRVIFPIYENGLVVCFSARSFLHFVEPDYLFPKVGETLLTTAEAIFGWDRAMEEKKSYYILVEGAIDAIAVDAKLVGCHALALMSNYMSDGQLYKLLKLPEGTVFIVCLDADAHAEGYRVAEKLNAFGRAVKIALLQRGDPASVSADTLGTVLDASRELSFDLEMSIMLKA